MKISVEGEKYVLQGFIDEAIDFYARKKYNVT